ncbi:hypothetical protein BVG79_01022 [Ketogulonicigenium robustum]|uniref:Carboxymuconolactone decarboxylase-like domain-containing protein n=1 Tax=Ketogulonicigenium robustum TaxID=92947 RepID=A0A1W6NYP3_9RHOB|nr:alkylhydroperoxidase domain protein [Ketogulonicigenium robustum]ARO14368.1 hypothetical protein BVG79_01022 [Ketogulonicigenium robustum]
MSFTISYPENHEPNVFTVEQLDWLPWIAPLAEEDLTEAHYDGLVDRARAKSEYFRLLARDPAVLGARTRTDKDIFYTKGGLPRPDRELAAAAVSRFNGCIYCASVHARFAIQFYKSDTAALALLRDGVTADLPAREALIVETAVALTKTPVAFGAENAQKLYDAGLSRDEAVDLIQSAAFFNWANRLMLSLGEPGKIA